MNIHVPVVKGSSDELLARWYSEGLDAFEHPLKGASTLLASLGPELKGLQDTEEPSCFEDFLKRSALMKEQVSQDLSSGHDRLLELGAPSSESAQTLIEHISNADHDPDFEKFVIRLFDYLGLEVEDLSLRSYIFKKGERLSEDFAEFPEDGLSVTFDRDFALAREDIALITPDHPLFRDAIEVLLSREQGNCSFAHWKTARGKTMLLECNYVLECLGPSRLHIDRFLPPTPYRTVVDHKGNDHSSDEGLPSANLEPRSPRKLVSQSVFRKEILPGMLKKAEQITGEQADSQIARAVEDAGKSLSAEIKRLHDLADKNNKVSPAEIEALTSHRDEILRLLGQSRLRLDALRLIWRTPA